MAVMSAPDRGPGLRRNPTGIQRYLPFTDWLFHYQRQDLPGDLMAGLIVAIMLVPQGMAYALLAGLPPQIGLYASIFPLFVYGLLGSSRVLAVGPVAIVSLLVAAGVSTLAGGDVAAYVQIALTLALLVGIIQVGMGLLRVGFLVNFLSHPVLVGFTAAAAIIIGFSQLKHVLGYNVPRFEHFYAQVLYTVQHLHEANWLALLIGVGSILILYFFKSRLPGLLKRTGVNPNLIVPISKSGPLLIVIFGVALTQLLQLHERFGLNIVADVPAGLPPLTVPTIDMNLWIALLPIALTISFVGYMESVSVAKSLASKRRQKIDANQELVALGAANLGATFTGGYPVTGGFSRSVVNYDAGANTGMASIVTGALILLTVLFLTPLFYYLPKAVLAAIILIAVVNLIDVAAFKHIWAYNKADAAALIITFFAVLIFGIERGILVGAAAAIISFVWRSSKPHMAVVGRIGKTDKYRNVLRYNVQTWPEVLTIRVDESLFFANTKYLEDIVLGMVADQPDVKYMILLGTAINFIDASALETLESLNDELKSAGVELHLAAMKGPVLDQLRKIGFVDELGPDRVHFSNHDAQIGRASCRERV